MSSKKLLTLVIVFYSIVVYSQPPNPNETFVNNLPDLHPATPDVTAIMKAEQLGISYTTGTPGFTIPFFSMQVGGFSLPISINYSSAGVRVDEVASSVGMGWNLTAGGVVSRIIYDRPDENRNNSNCNLNTINPDVYDQNLLDFLKDAPDKESDIFSFSFLGGSGKFIIGLDGQPKQLSQQNLKIISINNYFGNGFIITDDDGTEYHFTETEITNNREPLGENCGKTYNWSNVKTSWYLSKIVLPNKNKWIDFQYQNSALAYESSITQTLSKVITSVAECNGNGFICPIGSTKLSTCINKQNTQAKFISQVTSNEGDYISFGYTNRTDLEGGRQLLSIQFFNRYGNRIRRVDFNAAYYNATYSNNSGIYYYYSQAQQRLFLQSLSISGETGSSPLSYSFQYINPGQLPPRLSFAQDRYGFYNGKISNASLIPILTPGDINYPNFPPNGTSAGSLQFGDRSVDTTKSKNGLLSQITYPTGGYDVITYSANRYDNILAGGHSVSKISRYGTFNALASEKEFLYQNMDGSPSSFTLSNNLLFSVIKKTYTNPCEPPDPEFPTCQHAVLTSNITNPLANLGGQNLYYRSVLERNTEASGDNGVIEHLYSYFMGGNLDPRHRMGDRILTAPLQVVPEILRGETFTNVYRRNGASLELIKKTERTFILDNWVEYYNYVVNKKYTYNDNVYNPPQLKQFLPYDMEQVYINCFTARLLSVEETDFTTNGGSIVNRTDYEYANSNYTYPTKVTTRGSDNMEQHVEKKYPPDLPAYNFMVNRNIISPVMEEKIFKGTGQGNLLATKTKHFKDWFSDTKIIAPEWVNLILAPHLDGSKVVYYKYDINGNVQELSKDNNIHEVYLYGYKSTLPVARIIGTTYSSIAGYFDQNILDNPSNDAALRNHLKNLRDISGALVTIYTYNPQIGITSETDPNGFTKYYEYDSFNRLVLIRDQNNRILKKICYNYNGIPENCASPNIFYNEEISQVFTKNNCPPCYDGSPVTYTVQAGLYNASTQAAANQLAQNDINANGQANANTNGTCTQSSGTIISYNNTTNFTGFTATYTNNSTGQVYNFSVPGMGSGTLGCIPAGTYSLSISKPGNNWILTFGTGCAMQSGTSAYFGKVNIPGFFTQCTTVSIDAGY